MVTQVPDGELTRPSPAEQALIDHVQRGRCLDLAAKGEAVDEASMRSWGDARTISASVIRDILRGRLAADPDPHGLRLRGARISGRLDLENLITDVNLELNDCLLEEGVLARGARLAGFGLLRCQIEHPAEPPLDAERLTCNALILRGARITGHTAAAAVRLAGAHIGDSLDCDGAKLTNDSGPALLADGLEVGHVMLLRHGFTATGHGGDAAVRLIGAGSGLDGVVRLPGAHIGGSLLCDGAKLTSDSGPALVADGLEVGQAVNFLSGFTATGHGPAGVVRLRSAHIGDNLVCDGVKLTNDSGPALVADVVEVGHIMLLTGGCTGSGGLGAVRLAYARIGGLSCAGAKLTNDSGPALVADGLEVGQDMLLAGGFTAAGTGLDGVVRLPGALIGGSLDCDGATLTSDSGPALIADGLEVGQAMGLHNGFTATGSSLYGAVRLVGAHTGTLDCTGADLHNDSGPALIANALKVDQAMRLTGRFTGGGAGEAVFMTDARVGGALLFDPAGITHTADPQRRLWVDGLTYAGVPGAGRVSAQGWLQLLREGTPHYAAQPYQQLVAGCRALGDERQVREVLMAQRDDQLARALPRPGRPERLWGRITKVTLGYGYQPWRALLFLAAVIALSCVLAVVLGAHGALAQTKDTAVPGQPCTVTQRVSVGLDLNLPVGATLGRADCGLSRDPGSATATWLIAAGWVLRVLAWAFAALFIAGFTGAVRKT